MINKIVKKIKFLKIISLMIKFKWSYKQAKSIYNMYLMVKKYQNK